MKNFMLKQYRIIYQIDQWFNRRLTQTGMLLISVMVLAAVFGVDTSKSNTYQVFVFLLVVLLFSLINSLLIKETFKISRELPRYGTVGEPLHYNLHIQKTSAKTYYGLAVCETLSTAYPDFAQTAQFYQFARLPRYKRQLSFNLWRGYVSYLRGGNIAKLPLPAMQQSLSVQHSFIPIRRGVVHFAPAVIAKPDALGLFCRLLTAGTAENCIILPKRYAIKPLNLAGKRKYQAGGVSLANSVGNSSEFMALRDYQQGDALRTIHWKSYAKLGKLVVKDYQDEYFVRRALVLDTYVGNAPHAQFEAAVSVAASLASSEHYTEALLDLLFVGQESYCFTVGRGVDQLSHLQEVLASVQASDASSFKQLTDTVLARISLCSSLVCVFMDWDAQRQHFIQQLSAHAMPVAVFLLHDGSVNIHDCAHRPSHFYLLAYQKLAEQLASL